MHLCPLCGETFEDQTICPNDGAVLLNQKSRDDLPIGTILNDTYRVEERLGEGGMGAVYRVTQLKLGRSVALKILLPQYQATPDMVRRFFREAKNLSQLSHANIVSIFDFGNTQDGLVYMVMEYLDGVTLQDYVKKGRGLPEQVIVYIMKQVCNALTAAHKVNLIHRDLKPGNIFLARMTGEEEVVKVLDFGISKILDESDQQLTQTGMLMGTPGYIAPEQITDDGEPGICSDVYALGGILYFMMGGKAPFHEYTGRSAMFQQLQNDPNPIGEDALIDPSLQKVYPVVLKAMQRQPEDRYQTVSEMMEDLLGRAQTTLGNTVPPLGLPERVGANDPTISLSQLQVTSLPRSTSKNLPPRKPTQPIKRRGSLKVIGLIALLALLGVAGFFGKDLLFSGSKDPLVFGMSADFSGSNRENGREMQLGIETYFNEINQAGGVQGHPLELVALDDRYEPAPARINTLDLIKKHDVFALIGNVGTPTAEAVIPVVLDKKVLLFGPLTGASILRQNPPDRYIFNYRASYQEETAAMVRYFVDVVGIAPESIAVFSQNDGYGNDGFAGVVRSLRLDGIKEEDILHVRYERNQFNIQQAVDQVVAAPDRAKAIITIGTYKQTANFITEVRRTLPETVFSSISFVGALVLAKQFKETRPELAKGVIITQVVPFYNSSASTVLHYREQLNSFAPNQQPSFVSLEGYLTAKLLVEGLQRSTELTTDALIQSLEQMGDLDLGTGTLLSFGPSKHQASNKVWAVVMDENAELQELKLD